MKELTTRDITLKYVREKYDPEQHRQTTEDFISLGTIDMYQCGAMYKEQPKAEFFAWIEAKMKQVGCTHVKIDHDYDYTNFDMYKSTQVIETDQQVYTRLQKELKMEIKSKNKEVKQRTEYERLKAIYES